MRKILETKRLILREMVLEDFEDLKSVISDPETMKYYAKPYDDNGVMRWINWCIDSYKKNGFGLYALIYKENMQMIGDSGISLQLIDNELKPEIGYHIHRDYQNQGLGTEITRAIKDYFFTHFNYKEVYSYMNKENIPSIKLALKNGMSFVKEYKNLDEEDLLVYKITREEWRKNYQGLINNIPYVKLNNGYLMPSLGLGTWQIPNETLPKVIEEAYELGYRHFDSAIDYQNEEYVGAGINILNKREDVFVTTKILHNTKTYLEAKEAINNSLRVMNLDYIDLILIHSPKPWPELASNSPKTYFLENLEVWRALEEAYNYGKVRAIGLSNFSIVDMENIIKNGKIKPQVLQIRAHIGHMPLKDIAYATNNNIVVVSSSPLAHGSLKREEELYNIASKYHVSLEQLALRFLLNLGIVPIPKASSYGHLKANIELDFDISKEDMAYLLNYKEVDVYY